MQCYDCLDLVPLSQTEIHGSIAIYVKQLNFTNKKQHLYNKAKSTQLQSDWSAYKDIKKQVQRECRRAHDN